LAFVSELRDLEKKLIKALEELEIIDCHEHLLPERERVATPVDVFTLFSNYTRWDLMRAGMSETDYQSLHNQNIPLEKRWALFELYWKEIRWGSYAHAALLAAQKFYGFEDVNDKTCKPLSEAIRKANKPGIYERVLQKTCRIRTALTQCRFPKLDSPLLTPVVEIFQQMDNWEDIVRPWFDSEVEIRSLDDYLDTLRTFIVRIKAEGAVAVKMISKPYREPSRKEALANFQYLRRSKRMANSLSSNIHGDIFNPPNPLTDYVTDQMISFATEQDLVVAIHTGYWDDFRKLHPLHMIPILQRHSEARFDIFHLGFPWMRETLMLGKGFSNVWLNFCWVHLISQRLATLALDEAIDLIPMNKLLVFGGDYILPVEKVYGHLVMARENIARVLVRRILEGQMTETQALAIAQKWFWENPRKLYNLELK